MKGRNYKLSLLVIVPAMIIGACQKDINLPGIANDPMLYMPQSSRGTPFNAVEVVSREPGQKDTVYYRPYSAYLEGKELANQDIEVEFSIDHKKLDSLNVLELAAGRTAYELLPAGSYTEGTMKATIKKNERISSIQQFGINPKLLKEEKRYLVPISIKSVSPDLPVKSAFKTTYYQVSLTVPDFVSGTYTAGGMRNGDDYGTDPTKVRKTITKVANHTYDVNLIANLGPWCCSNKFTLKVNPADHTVLVSGHLEDAGNLLTNREGTVSTFDPATNTFVLFYNYSYYGFVAKMSETLKKL
ncbi:DUF1735 domain-containing protein [Pedobacter caeni]|uniref:BT-3987-like N-terminal domain-containing protein n=1 Tax=Pedobacter caeni TaxID=288992 RepID=A0A1M4V3P1_9SPHI|nr:DUF1735 domain-containing protein [Pedobacter caeni]SHE63555.1 protein of unknown function [Pedobacter caeni]